MRDLFSLVEDGKQLQLVKYNKSLQKILNLNIMHYKVFSGKYTIYEDEANVYGKIYNAFENKLIFEGELINGRKNGKGKEYNDFEELIFEGEYLNGKKNGKVKEYNENGKLIFEGEYLNGERNGKGKEYSDNSIIEYEGDYLNDKKNGKGKEYYSNSELKFEELFLDRYKK